MAARSFGIEAIIKHIASPMASGATIDSLPFIFTYKQDVFQNYSRLPEAIHSLSFLNHLPSRTDNRYILLLPLYYMHTYPILITKAIPQALTRQRASDIRSAFTLYDPAAGLYLQGVLTCRKLATAKP
jgi:hypothetical protein